MNISYDLWAKYLLEEIMLTPEHLREALLKEHLLKAERRGYTDGKDNSWWKEQEKDA